jgi:nitroimidazol reductase NimA-like FMN-containing flavoprotein (pyridoxamine 5'-phosphate oxidase superfamily)
MKKTRVILIVFAAAVLLQAGASAAEKWEKGGPKWLYVTPTAKPPHHGVYDETMKCIDCHSYDGVDAYTSATMAMKKSTKGSMPRKEIEAAIAEALKGRGDYREIFVLATAFDNKPLATVIEFVLDPKTFTFYAISEKQTEKLFQMHSNANVSMAYVRHRTDYDYFGGALGVQVVGKAKLLTGVTGDEAEFAEGAKIYLPTLPGAVPTGVQPPPLEDMINMIKGKKIITKITPERIVILNRSFKEKGFHAVQIWTPEKK